VSKINKKAHLFLQLTGPIGSIISSIISDAITEEEITKLNKKISILDNELKDFQIMSFKLINRLKVKNFLVKAISEDSEYFLELACLILKDNEENFESIVDAFNILNEKDLNTLYFNLWKKSKLKEFTSEDIKKCIYHDYELEPDVVFSHAYRVNKEVGATSEKGLLLGNSLTIMPQTELSNIFNEFEKLSHNNLIRISIYISKPNDKDSPTYLCINFTCIGVYICRLMESIERNNK